jgi:succinyl-diaminopimelate desuccinylase
VLGFTPDGEYPLINGEKGIYNLTIRRDWTQTGPVRIRTITGGTAPNVVPSQAAAELNCPPDLAGQIGEILPEKVRAIPLPFGVRLEAQGLGAHASTPETGENAIGRLLLALNRLPLAGEEKETLAFLAEKIGMETDGDSLGIALEDEESGKLTFNLGVITGDETGILCQINCRHPVRKSLADFQPRLLARLREGGFRVLEERYKKSLYVPPDSELVTKLLGVYHRETGLNAVPKMIGGGTYAKAMPNIVAFGPVFPGDPITEHQPDEYIRLDRLMENAQIIAAAMWELAK